MLAVPSNVTPPIVRPVASAVAVLALPVRSPVNVVAATEVRPAKEIAVAPKDTVVLPIVTELFVSEAFPMLEIVLDDPLIVLLLNVSVLDALATASDPLMFTAPANVTLVVFAGPIVATVVPPLFLMAIPLEPLVCKLSTTTVPDNVGEVARTIWPDPVTPDEVGRAAAGKSTQTLRPPELKFTSALALLEAMTDRLIVLPVFHVPRPTSHSPLV